MHPAFLNDRQDRAFAAHILDLFAIAEQKYIPRFSGFLDMHQSTLARQIASGQGHRGFLFFGGHPESERVMLGVFPPYEEPDPGAFPIVPLTLRFRSEDPVGHRDLLGALMGLELRRETVGDILLEPGHAVLFTSEAVAPVVLSELTKVGRWGVKVSQGLPERLPALHRYQDKSVNVSAARLDCIVAAVAGCSREKAAQTVRAQLVSVNGLTVGETAHLLREGDVISIRGCGKFLFAQETGNTRKGRLCLLFKKYI